MFRKWNNFPDVEAFVHAVTACNFTTTNINIHVDYKKSRGSVRVRTSFFLAPSVYSSHPDEIQCSRFRIRMLPQLYFKRKWNMEPALLHVKILGLFREDGGCCESFITDQTRKLEFFSFYVYGDEGVQQESKKSIPEVKVFQPL